MSFLVSRTDNITKVYAGQNGAITLAFSESGAMLAAACCDDPLPGRFPIRLIDSETGRCRHELKGHASMVYSLVWSPGDSFLLSASADGTAKVRQGMVRCGNMSGFAGRRKHTYMRAWFVSLLFFSEDRSSRVTHS